MNIVRCEDIKKHFSGRAGIVQALDGVSLDIEKGSAFGLVGESGCGKTTLGKIILGILKPDQGRIESAAKSMQVVFQDPYNSPTMYGYVLPTSSTSTYYVVWSAGPDNTSPVAPTVNTSGAVTVTDAKVIWDSNGHSP